MAEFLHFSRDTRVYIEKDNALWYIPVLDGFSFSQATNTSEITLSEMEDAFGRSRRGMKMFTDSLSAAEWSFSTYMRPFIAAGGGTARRGRADDAINTHHAVEEALWGMMAGRPDYDRDAFDWEHDATLGGAISATPTYTADVSGVTIDAKMQGEYELVINSNLSTLVAPDGVTKITSTLANDYIWVDNGTTPTNDENLAKSGYDDQNSTVDQGMRNAVVKFTLDADGVVSGVTVTERGTRFFSGDRLLITTTAWGALATALGGGTAPDAALEFTFGTVESFTQVADTRANGGKTTVNFYDSNRAGLNTCTIYFFMNKGKEGGRLLYALEQAVVNEATIDFDVEGIATINWSGFAGQIKEMTVGGDTTLKIEGNDRVTNLQVDGTFDGTNAEPTTKSDGLTGLTTGDLVIAASQDDALYIYDGIGVAKAIDEGTTDTGNFIRNRLTQLTIAPTASFIAANPNEFQTSYSIPLTGGSITITNNINYLTPEELGLVNQPIEHVTGTRSCTGSMTCYLGASNVAEDRSKDLFNDLVNDTNSVINEFDLTFSVGGTDNAFPVVQFNIPLAHISVPTHSIEDVISLEATFAAQGTAIGEADEFNVVFLGT